MKLVVADVTKEFPTNKGKAVRVLENIMMNAAEKEIIAILGPSGCGKTTLLRVIAGLEAPTYGEVLLDGERITKPNPGMGMIFQEYSLLPWATIEENVSIGLEIQGASSEEIKESVGKYLRLVGLQDVADSHPHELSGGMRQRVAVARALTMEPRVLLMDEPFSALDPQTRNMIQSDILTIMEMTRKTIILVTHSVEEAVYLADRLIILSAKPGRVHTVIPVLLPRPRDRGSSEFTRLRMQVLDLLDRLKVA
jgi:NitT/TauT family transport system ATP-binding protein